MYTVTPGEIKTSPDEIKKEIEEGVNFFKEKVWGFCELTKEIKNKFILLIREGASKREACRELKISYQDLSKYIDGDKEFKFNLINAFEDSLGWYDQQARLNFNNRNFNFHLYNQMRDNQKKEKFVLIEEYEKGVIIENYLRKLLEMTIKEEIDSNQFLEKAECIRNFQNCITIEKIKQRIDELEKLSNSEKI